MSTKPSETEKFMWINKEKRFFLIHLAFRTVVELPGDLKRGLWILPGLSGGVYSKLRVDGPNTV